MTTPPIPDPDTDACLGNGWHAVVAVDHDGHAWPWLLDVADLDGDGNGCRAACCAPHEQLGRLPVDVRRRINRCSATNSTSRSRCRNPAPAGHDYCHVHQGGR